MKNRPYIFLSFITIFCLFFFLPAKQSYAQGTALSISPTVIRIQAKPPADVWTPFTIQNNSDQPITLKIGYKAFDPQASSNGSVVFLNDGQSIPGIDEKIFDKMQIVDDQNTSHDTIDIGPKQKLRFRLRITLPTNEPASDYYFSLIFLQMMSPVDQNTSKTTAEIQKSFSMIQSGLGLDVLLSVGDKETPQASIDNFSSASFFDKGPVLFTLSMHNSGSHFINPHGVILIRNIFGQTVGKVIIPSTIVLAGTSRNLASTAIQTSTKTNSNEIGPVWTENFLLGIYSATLTITLSDNGPVYIRTVHFTAIPFIFLIEIVVILIAIIYIYVRVKRKLSNS